MPPSQERRPLKKLKSKKEPREEEKLLSYSNIINNQLMIKKHMKNWLMNLCSKKQKDNTKWEKPSGKEKSKLESTSWKMFINLEKRTSFWSNKGKRKWNGSNNMKRIKLKLLLPSKTLSLRLELLKNKQIERIIKWIFWSKWTKRIESKELTFKKKCTKREPLSWLS